MDYLSLAYKLKDLLDNDPRIVSLNNIEKELEESEEIMKLVYQKNMKENDLSDILRHFEKESKEARDATVNLYHAADELYAHPLVKKYLEAYEEVEKLFNKINDILFKELKEGNQNAISCHCR